MKYAFRTYRPATNWATVVLVTVVMLTFGLIADATVRNRGLAIDLNQAPSMPAMTTTEAGDQRRPE
jgi:hypothetical protein